MDLDYIAKNYIIDRKGDSSLSNINYNIVSKPLINKKVIIECSSEGELVLDDSTIINENFNDRTKDKKPVKNVDAIELLNLSTFDDSNQMEISLNNLDSLVLCQFGLVKKIITNKNLLISTIENIDVKLDINTLIFTVDKKPIAYVKEVFGPINSPFYITSIEPTNLEIIDYLNVGTTVYYCKGNNSLTKEITNHFIELQKGSDASWTNDQEPPDECLEYSDDENERKAKKAKKKLKTMNSFGPKPNKISHNSFNTHNSSESRFNPGFSYDGRCLFHSLPIYNYNHGFKTI